MISTTIFTHLVTARISDSAFNIYVVHVTNDCIIIIPLNFVEHVG